MRKLTVFWSPFRILLTVVVIGLLMVMGVSSCNSSNPKPSTPPTITVKSAPTSNALPVLAPLPAIVRDTELKAASGAPIKLSDYSGKVLLVNLWATWCGPCRMETPELVKLHKEFRTRGVEMIGLSTEDPEASAESVRMFVREYNVDYRIGWATADVATTLMQGRNSIPQSFIITKDGRVLKRFIGFAADRTPQQLRAALEEALKS